MRGAARPKQVVTTTVDGVRVHEIVAAEPYAFAARSPRIQDGHVIVVGKVVAVRVLAYMCAVTEDIGEFAVLDTETGGPWATIMGGRYRDAYRAATIVAAKLNAPLRRTPGPKRRTPARKTPPKTAGSSATRTAAASKTASRVSSAATTRRGAAPRRAVPGVQFSDGRG